MKKEEYLKALEGYLKKTMPPEEVTEILSDYDEYFEDGRRQGKTDEEISARLGAPELIAAQFLEEEGESFQTKKQKSREFLKQLREKATEEWNNWKEKVPNVEMEAGKGFFAGIFDTAGSFIETCIRLLLAMAVLFGLGLLVFFGAMAALAVLGCGIGLIGSGLGLLVAAAFSFGILTTQVSIGGVFASVFLIAAGLLVLVLLAMVLRMVLWGLWRLWKKLFGGIFKKKQEA